MAGRPRKFDEDKALDAFMDVFWTKGYAATSVDDLQDAIGIKRGSFYSTFESKDAVFSSVLDRYVQRRTLKGLDLLDDPAGPRKGLARFLRHIGNRMAEDTRRGCLIFSNVSERSLDGTPQGDQLAELNALIAGRIQEKVDLALKGLAESDTGSAEQLSAFVMTTLFGLNGMARTGADPKDIRAAAELAAQTVEANA
ncbi:TetR/AcrR family transcriptional regulator [Roseibium denhamense]|uniref:Transcriptional regulator, TetR family n=1 Tax=Roseibium denhamense TaxID=76305 RepID=A0ABY1NB30_9HYPH|nr:TetR/AcrR family transcriptional regulator [Roseibium denhamense]MTI06576.1 TetR/AcrR family transcriptional regulator [Roseibium denhamense]SMP05289.1 transcriptional regulator, TetR family [Roseibium denhamense]